MTIAVPVHRALSVKVAPRSFNVVTRWGYNPWLARVNSTTNDEHNIYSTGSRPASKSRYAGLTRFYATKAAGAPASRPKAHTGRAPARKPSKTSTSSKPGPKTAAGKKRVGRRPKAKATGAKTRTKSKAKPKPKKPAVKKAPSATALLRNRRAKDKELREKALLNPPTSLPTSPWKVLFSEAHKGERSFGNAAQTTKDAAQKLKNLTPEEKEHYNHVANQNKAANQATFKKWLSQYTPEQIQEANNARNQLRRLYKEKYPNKTRTAKYAVLKDDRLVTRPRNAFVFFTQDRHASGDFAHMAVGESAKLIGREWKALSANERKKFDDSAAADLKRYIEEFTSVYGHPPEKAGKPKAK